MGALTILLQLTLSVVFLVAGTNKLRDQTHTRETLLEFGVPGSATKALGILVPIVELAVAVLVITPAISWFGSLLCAVLVTLLTVVLAYNLIKGRRPACNCFGQAGSQPIGVHTLARNLIFALISFWLLLVSEHEAYASNWHQAWTFLSDLTPIISGAVAFGSWFSFQLFKQNGRVLLRLEALERAVIENGVHRRVDRSMVMGSSGMPIGTEAPDFHLLESMTGRSTSLSDLLAVTKPIILVFVNPGCGPCVTLVPRLVEWQAEFKDELTFVIITQGGIDVFQKAFGISVGGVRLLTQDGNELSNIYGVHGTPGAVLILADGKVGSQVALGADAIWGIIHDVTEVASRNPDTEVVVNRITLPSVESASTI